jgi:hypothetical protein
VASRRCVRRRGITRPSRPYAVNRGGRRRRPPGREPKPVPRGSRTFTLTARNPSTSPGSVCVGTRTLLPTDTETTPPVVTAVPSVSGGGPLLLHCSARIGVPTGSPAHPLPLPPSTRHHPAVNISSEGTMTIAVRVAFISTVRAWAEPAPLLPEQAAIAHPTATVSPIAGSLTIRVDIPDARVVPSLGFSLAGRPAEKRSRKPRSFPASSCSRWRRFPGRRRRERSRTRR